MAKTVAYTPFSAVNEVFYSKIVDDMYMELTPQETEDMSLDFLMNAIPFFEFPRVNIFDYDKELRRFNVSLSLEEINILATYMIVCWFDTQLATIENTRLKYSGTDFKFTSQANHMQKLLQLKKDYEREGFHLQRLYKRRIVTDSGQVRSTMNTIMKTPSVWRE